MDTLMHLFPGFDNLPVLDPRIIERPDVNKIKSKVFKGNLVEPQATVGMPPEQVIALANPRIFQPLAETRPDPLLGLSGPDTVCGVKLGRGLALSVLRKVAPEEYKRNAKEYGPPPDGALQPSRDYRAAFGGRDYVSKYHAENIADGPGKGMWGRFPDVGKGIMLGVSGPVDQTDEGLDIVQCWSRDGGSVPYYRQVNDEEIEEEVRKLPRSTVVYGTTTSGDADGMVIGEHATKAYAALYDKGYKLCISWDVTKDFPVPEARVDKHVKNLKHNNEIIVVLDKHAVDGQFLENVCDDYYMQQTFANDVRNQALNDRSLKWSPPPTKMIWRPGPYRGQLVPVRTGKGLRSVGVLAKGPGQAKKEWKKLINNPEKPPVPFSPVALPHVYFASGYEPCGLDLRACFASFVHDPRFKAEWSQKHGWIRRRNKEVGDWPAPDVKAYAKWIMDQRVGDINTTDYTTSSESDLDG